jgi:pimeloyl-ACP methyl ester carboxylesterase
MKDRLAAVAAVQDVLQSPGDDGSSGAFSRSRALFRGKELQESFMRQTLRAIPLTLLLFAVPEFSLPQPAEPPEPKKVSVADGVELHYIEQGKGIPVVFVHGTIGDYGVWHDYLRSFAQHYRAIAYSRRYNHPNTNPVQPNYSAIVDAEDLAALIKKLDLGKVHLIGHSYGAYTALFLAVKHPELVRSLTLAEPPVRFSGDRLDEARARMVTRLRAVKKGDTEGALRAFIDGLDPGSYDKIPEAARREMLRNARELEAAAASDDLFPGLDRQAVRKLDVPTLLVSGEQSFPFLKNSDQELERLLPEKRRQRVIIADTGHWMLFQKPDECRKAILEFLRDK